MDEHEPRINALLAQRGYRDPGELLAAHPGASLGELYGILTAGISNPRERPGFAFLPQAIGRWAIREKRVREIAAELLARAIRDHKPKGWAKSKPRRVTRGTPFGHWSHPLLSDQRFLRGYDVFDPNTIDKLVWRAIEELPPPDDWLPENGKDPIIQQAFDKAGWVE